MNREQRRKMAKKTKNDPKAIYCPLCGCKTYAVAVISPDPNKCDVHCEMCGFKHGRVTIGQFGVYPDTEVDGSKWDAAAIVKTRTEAGKAFFERFAEVSYGEISEGSNKGTDEQGDCVSGEVGGTETVDNAVHE